MNIRFAPCAAAAGGLAWAIAFPGGAATEATWTMPAIVVALVLVLIGQAGVLSSRWGTLSALAGSCSSSPGWGWHL